MTGTCVRGEGVGFQPCRKLLCLESPDTPAERFVPGLRQDVPRHEQRILSILLTSLPERRLRAWGCDSRGVGKGGAGRIARVRRRRGRSARGVRRQLTANTADAGEFNLLRTLSLHGRRSVRLLHIGALVFYNLLALVATLPHRTPILLDLKCRKILRLLVLFPELLYRCEANRLTSFKRGGEAFEAVVALGWTSHLPRLYREAAADTPGV